MRKTILGEVKRFGMVLIIIMLVLMSIGASMLMSTGVPKLISTCDVVYAASCPSGGVHEYSITIIKKVTETKDGLEKHTCSKCGDSYTEVIPKTGHNYTDWQTKTPATCNMEGVLYKVCTICDKSEYKKVPATGKHNYESWKVQKKVTCTSDGESRSTCSVCGHQEIKIAQSAGHKYELKSTETVDEMVIKTSVCSVCGDKKIDKTLVGEVEAQVPGVSSSGEVESGDSGNSGKESGGPNALDIVLLTAIAMVSGTYAILFRRDLRVINWDKTRKAALKAKL